MRKNKYSVVVVLSLIIKDHCVDARLRIEGEDAVKNTEKNAATIQTFV